jgi:hypothetical protein
MHQSGLVTRSDEDEPPQSVIHAPAGFSDFVRISLPHLVWYRLGEKEASLILL